MSYSVELGANARADLSKMPAPVAAYAVKQLEALGAHANQLSKPSHFPYREGSMMFQFDYDWNGKRYFFTVLFRYSADETRLLVSDIAWQEAEDW